MFYLAANILFFSLFALVVAETDLSARIKASVVLGKVYFQNLETKAESSACWKDVLQEFKNISYESCTQHSTWMKMAVKMTLCEGEDMKRPHVQNCTEEAAANISETKTCISKMDDSSFIDFCVFSGMIQSICLVQHVSIGASAWARLTGTFQSVKSGYVNLTNGLSIYLRHKESEYKYIPRSVLRGTIGQFIFLHEVYEDFRNGQILFLAIWLLLSILIGRWKDWKYCYPVLLCISVELVSSVLYETWIGYFMDLFGINDHIIAIVTRYVCFTSQILGLEIFPAIKIVAESVKLAFMTLINRRFRTNSISSRLVYLPVQSNTEAGSSRQPRQSNGRYGTKRRSVSKGR